MSRVYSQEHNESALMDVHVASYHAMYARELSLRL